MASGREKSERVLDAISLNVNRTIEEIASITGLPAHGVQYALQRIRRSSAFRPYCLVNPHRLGLTDYCLFLNPIGNAPRLVERAVEVLLAFPHVAYLTELVGEFRFTASCFATDIRPVDQMLKKLQAALPKVNWDVQFAVRVEWTIFERASTSHSTRASLCRSVEVDQQAIDDKDLRLLTVLLEEPTLPFHRASHKAGLPEATGRLRLRKLQESGVVLGFPCHLDPLAPEDRIYRIIISTTSRSDETDRDFREFGRSHSQISDFVTCIGAWDYEYNLYVSDALAVGLFLNDLQTAFYQKIREIRTMSHLRTHKAHAIKLQEVVTPLS